MMRVNDPMVVEEVTAAFQAYEWRSKRTCAFQGCNFMHAPFLTAASNNHSTPS